LLPLGRKDFDLPGAFFETCAGEDLECAMSKVIAWK
jgi:hypothetical protein